MPLSHYLHHEREKASSTSRASRGFVIFLGKAANWGSASVEWIVHIAAARAQVGCSVSRIFIGAREKERERDGPSARERERERESGKAGER